MLVLTPVRLPFRAVLTWEVSNNRRRKTQVHELHGGIRSIKTVPQHAQSAQGASMRSFRAAAAKNVQRVTTSQTFAGLVAKNVL